MMFADVTYKLLWFLDIQDIASGICVNGRCLGLLAVYARLKARLQVGRAVDSLLTESVRLTLRLRSCNSQLTTPSLCAMCPRFTDTWDWRHMAPAATAPALFCSSSPSSCSSSAFCSSPPVLLRRFLLLLRLLLDSCNNATFRYVRSLSVSLVSVAVGSTPRPATAQTCQALSQAP